MKLRTVIIPAIISFLLLCISPACEKALEISPSKVALNDDNVYTTDGGAQSVVSGIYMDMASSGKIYNGNLGISLLLGLSADELINPYPDNVWNTAAYTNGYTAGIAPAFWSGLYHQIFVCNLAIKGISNSEQITAPVKKQLLAELKFIRAFGYFYAVNLYGDVPLTLTEDYEFNNTIARSPEQQVYQQIIADLSEAQANLADDRYVDASGATVPDRVRPNKQVVTALLARVYLYMQDWKNAEEQASALIANPNYMLEPDLDRVFLRTSKEAIWQFQPVSDLYSNTVDAIFLVVNNINFAANGVLPVSTHLMQSFEAGDLRATNWIGRYQTTITPLQSYNYAFKYKVAALFSPAPATEYPVVFRLAEQYLIRAEARANQNDFNGAAQDLYALRKRAGLGQVSTTDKNNLLAAIERERRNELFCEWGHRWFDLKRTGRLNAVMTTITPGKGGSWGSYKQFFPVPADDVAINPNIGQTIGY